MAAHARIVETAGGFKGAGAGGGLGLNAPGAGGSLIQPRMMSHESGVFSSSSISCFKKQDPR